MLVHATRMVSIWTKNTSRMLMMEGLVMKGPLEGRSQTVCGDREFRPKQKRVSDGKAIGDGGNFQEGIEG